MICKKCGFEADEKDKFCIKCGSKLTDIASNNNEKASDDYDNEILKELSKRFKFDYSNLSSQETLDKIAFNGNYLRFEESLELNIAVPLSKEYAELLEHYGLSQFDGYEIRFKVKEDIDRLDLTQSDIKKRLSHYISFKVNPSKKALQKTTGYGLFIFNHNHRYLYYMDENKSNKKIKDSFIERMKQYNLRGNYYNLICFDVLFEINNNNLSSSEIENKINDLLEKSATEEDGEIILNKLTGYNRNGEYEFHKSISDEANLKGISQNELEQICKRIIEELDGNLIENSQVKDRLGQYIDNSLDDTKEKYLSLTQNGLQCDIKRKGVKTEYRKVTSESGGQLKRANVFGPNLNYQGRIYYEEPDQSNTYIEPYTYPKWEYEGTVVYAYEDYFSVAGSQIFYKDISIFDCVGDEISIVHGNYSLTLRMPTEARISDEKTRLIYKAGFYNLLKEKTEDSKEKDKKDNDNESKLEDLGKDKKANDNESKLEDLGKDKKDNDNESKLEDLGKDKKVNDKLETEDMGKLNPQDDKDINSTKSEKDLQVDEYLNSEKKCPKCGKGLQKDFDFCPYCGHNLLKRACPKCLTIYENDFTHCPKCGLRLATPEEFKEIVALTGKARESYDNDDFKGAIDILKVQLEYYPNPEDILFLLGDCYFNLKDYDNSNKYLDKLIEINPHYEKLWYKKAMTASLEKDYEKEEEYCLKEIESYPNNKEPYLLLIDSYCNMEKYEKIDSALEDMLKLEDGEEFLLQFYLLLGKGEKGETEQSKMLKEKIKKHLL